MPHDALSYEVRCSLRAGRTLDETLLRLLPRFGHGRRADVVRLYMGGLETALETQAKPAWAWRIYDPSEEGYYDTVFYDATCDRDYVAAAEGVNPNFVKEEA